MNENEFELDGKIYVKIEGGSCDNCCFFCDWTDWSGWNGCTNPQLPCINDDVSYKEKQS